MQHQKILCKYDSISKKWHKHDTGTTQSDSNMMQKNDNMMHSWCKIHHYDVKINAKLTQNPAYANMHYDGWHNQDANVTQISMSPLCQKLCHENKNEKWKKKLSCDANYDVIASIVVVYPEYKRRMTMSLTMLILLHPSSKYFSILSI